MTHRQMTELPSVGILTQTELPSVGILTQTELPSVGILTQTDRATFSRHIDRQNYLQ